MPLDHLMKRRGIGAQDAERLQQAFRLALSGLQLVDRNDPVCELVARKVIAIGMDGTRDPHDIAALTIKQLGP